MTEILVAFGGYDPGPAGAERMAIRTIELLARRGHQLTVLTDALPPAYALPPAAALPSAAAMPSAAAVQAAAQPGYAVPRVCRTAEELAMCRPEIVHAFDLAKPAQVGDALGIARRCGAVLALTPASASGVWPDPEVARAACRSADVVFALTPAEAASLTSAGAAPDRIRFIPQACELTGTPDPAGFRRASGLTGQIALFVGRRTAFKGYLTLLEAMPLVWDRLPEVAFVFIGPNSDADAAAAFRAHSDRRLVDLAVVDDQTKHDALAACDVLCLPTSHDVFPLVFAEAWTLGKPVISGDYPGSDVVVRDGVDGLIVKPRPAELADALTRLLFDHPLREEMGRAGRQRAENEFGWDKMADAFQEGYGWALDKKARARA